MRLITRYLLREFLGPLVVCLVTFNALFMIVDLFDSVSRFLDAGLPWWLVLRYYGGMLSLYSHWFTPAALLLATLYTMWRLSRNSEITAMRVSGLSFGSLAMPFIAVSVIMALLTAAMMECVAPDASHWAIHLKNHKFNPQLAREDIRHNTVYRNPAMLREWRFSTINMASAATAASVAGKVEIVQERVPGKRLWHMEAQQAQYRDGAWWMTRPVFTAYDDEGYRAGEPKEGLPFMRIPELTETPRDILVASREIEHCSIRDMWRRVKHHGEDTNALRFDLWFRMAMPWSCVVLVLFAIPTGLTTARQSIMKGLIFALCAFIGFYIITQFGVFLGKRGLVSPVLAAWAPNALWLVMALFLYRKLR